ncbi:MAG: hypothetical protein HYV09_04145 [Deltaproteobacteria bacterium]|nr:hypothetical protein [Deltaproteobacteria bacterium]
MRTVDFYGLTRAAQDHFIDAAAAAQPPVPLLVRPGGPTAHRIGWIVAALGVIGAILLYRTGYGDLGSDAVVHGVALAFAWVVAIGLVLGGALHAIAGERAIGALPWKAGVYAFPTGVVDARTHLLRVADVDALERVEIAGTARCAVVIVIGGQAFSFAADAAAAEKAKQALEQARAEGPASNPMARASLDPLAEPRVSSPLAPTNPRTREVPAWARTRFVVAAVAALAVGPTLWHLRNVGSDDRAFAEATRQNDVASYKAYLQWGVRHRDEVRKTLLPRAELALAKKQGTVDAIIQYQASHPQSAIQTEVDASLRAALLVELATAKKAGTLAALTDFEKRRPGHGLNAEVAAARHEVYQAALASFRARANPKDPNVIAFFERLLASAEKRGDPKVEIRFRQQPSVSLLRADKYVAKHPLFNGETSYPSRYFGPGKLAKHEASLGKVLVDALSAAFPGEVLSFSIGAPAPEGEPNAAAPTLFLLHRPEWTGMAQPTQRPRGIYVAMNHHFDAQLTAPGETRPIKVSAVIIRPIPLGVLKDYQKGFAKLGDPETAVYGTMAKESFELFGARFVGAIFEKK